MDAQRFFLAFGFLILVAVGAAAIVLDTRWRFETAMAAHSLEATSKLLELRLRLRRAQGAQYGYLLTGDQRFRDDYRVAADAIMPAFAELKAVTQNPGQTQRLAEIEPELVRGLSGFEEVLRIRAAGDAAASSLLASGQGRAATDSLAAAFDRFAAAEQSLLALRSAASHRNVNVFFAIGLFSAALIFVMVLVSVLIVRRSNREREAALRLASAANADLEAAVAERTEHLRLANEEIRQSAIIMNNSAIVISNAVSTMAEALVVIDERRTVLLANPAATRLFGWQPGATIEQSRVWAPAFQPDGETPLAPDQVPMARALRGEQFDRTEFVVRGADAQDNIHIVASGRPLLDAAGETRGAVMVYHDVTAARETEHQLRQVQKLDAIGHLTGGIAHDFNNMLTVIIGCVEILTAALGHDRELLALAGMIDQAAERGAELTRHLLAFARKQPLQPQATDVNALIVETAKLLPTIGEQIEIKPMLNDAAWPALVDPGQLATALLNLALNARDAMPGGGKLTLETGNVVLDEAYARSNAGVTPGAYLMVAVSDNGTGIPAAIRDEVFEPFFTTKGIGKGTGLGLSMVYGFVKQSNGHIKIYSEEGHGTTIKIYLPRAGAQAGALAEAGSRVPLACGSETILVVEDDTMVRGYAITQLQSLGYTTIAAANGTEALAIVDRGTEFDLLFTDLIMPGMNGSQLAAEIRMRRPLTKVLMSSGYSENAITHNGQLDDGVLLLSKPYRKSDLARMLRTALDGAPAVKVRKWASQPLKSRIA